MAVYLDHAASTPMLPEARSAMLEESTRTGNASSLHTAGRRARRVVEESRELLAEALGARPSEVVFTSGGTEADNLAVKGLFWARHEADPRRSRILVGAIEHHAVLDAVEWLVRHEGAEVTWLPVDRLGRLDVAAAERAVATDPASVALITVMWANNEVGTLQPVEDIVALATRYGIPVHSDAVQAVGHLPVDFGAVGLDAMTVSGHKTGGPLGAGALLLRRGAVPVALLHGGGQEGGLRSGTLATPLVLGLATAVGQAVAEREALARRLTGLSERLVRAVLSRVPDAVLRGDPDPSRRLPGIVHLTFPGCEGDSLLYLLDARGIECSTGSACQVGLPRPSHVLLAMGVDEDDARGALRFSLGHTSTRADVDALADAIAPVVDRARRAGLVGAVRPAS
ncbi:MAG: cysteine desulfurase [Actinomycetales bacterium]|nr:cysteine desulfurase [Actinomycetales bacterium]